MSFLSKVLDMENPYELESRRGWYDAKDNVKKSPEYIERWKSNYDNFRRDPWETKIMSNFGKVLYERCEHKELNVLEIGYYEFNKNTLGNILEELPDDIKVVYHSVYSSTPEITYPENVSYTHHYVDMFSKEMADKLPKSFFDIIIICGCFPIHGQEFELIKTYESCMKDDYIAIFKGIGKLGIYGPDIGYYALEKLFDSKILKDAIAFDCDKFYNEDGLDKLDILAHLSRSPVEFEGTCIEKINSIQPKSGILNKNNKGYVNGFAGIHIKLLEKRDELKKRDKTLNALAAAAAAASASEST